MSVCLQLPRERGSIHPASQRCVRGWPDGGGLLGGGELADGDGLLVGLGDGVGLLDGELLGAGLLDRDVGGWDEGRCDGDGCGWRVRA